MIDFFYYNKNNIKRTKKDTTHNDSCPSWPMCIPIYIYMYRIDKSGRYNKPNVMSHYQIK